MIDISRVFQNIIYLLYLPLVFGCLALIFTHMHILAVQVKEGLLFTRGLPYFSDWICSFIASHLFPLLITVFVFMHNFYAILSNIDEVLSINPFVNDFDFGDLNVLHKDYLTYFAGTVRSDKLFYSFLFQISLLRWLTFLLASLSKTLTVLFFWIYFF